MKMLWKPNKLPALVLGCGGMALVLRRLLYAAAVDHKGLLTPWHPLEGMLAVLSLGTLAAIWLTVRKLKGSRVYSDNFGPSKGALLGHCAGAAGIVLTVLTDLPPVAGIMSSIWQILGWLSPVCLVLAGIFRLRGRTPFFGLHLVPSVFGMVHLVSHYRLWSGNPQLQDYVFLLLGVVSVSLFSFYSASFEAGEGERVLHLGMGLSAVYLLLAELAHTTNPWLCLGGIAWALTDLCSLTPVPEPADGEGE